ncbi:hypothetical protein [Micromonospora sp. NPDC005174]|uniref:hypothetical protein n=1 Tax=Micromonospora sp. NPDC005174 TaxID=3157018 RepID=UPI0033B14FD0
MLGASADVSVDTYLLRRIELRLSGANWQRGGGKGKRPEPVPLPGDPPTVSTKPQQVNGGEVAQRLRNLGLIPPGDANNT